MITAEKIDFFFSVNGSQSICQSKESCFNEQVDEFCLGCKYLSSALLWNYTTEPSV